MLEFTYKKPEETGINSNWIVNFLNRLETQELPLHSFILMKDDSIIAETYYAPYKKDTLHRMFSVTKSMVSVAIGILASEGTISLDDKISKYFPEYIKDNTHPYILQMTIQDMLKMGSCHSSTTYKNPGMTDWVESFFITQPDHIPGTSFLYDTSSTHTLCALVEKLTNMKMLDYLRSRFLDEAGFSKEAYVKEAPNGESLGGSGLYATSMDLLRFMYIVKNKGMLNGKEVIPSSYIDEAVKCQAITYAKSNIWEEMQGYGYQFWRTSHDGYCCYGMGGQYAIYYPNEKVMLITTADTQGRNGGNQVLFDAFYQEILDKLSIPNPYNDINPCYSSSYKEPYVSYEKYMATRRIPCINGSNTSSILHKINNTRYNVFDNKSGYEWFELSVTNFEGTFDYCHNGVVYSLPFGIGYNQEICFPGHNDKACVSGAFVSDTSFLIKVHIIDWTLGNIHIIFDYKDNDLTVYFRKTVEDDYNEFNGFVSATR